MCLYASLKETYSSKMVQDSRIRSAWNGTSRTGTSYKENRFLYLRILLVSSYCENCFAGFCFRLPLADLFVLVDDFGGSECALFKSDSRPGVLRLELHGLTNGVRSGVEGCATVCRLRVVVGLLLPEIDTHALSYPYI